MERKFLQFALPLLLMMGVYIKSRSQENIDPSNSKESKSITHFKLKRDYSNEGIRTYYEYKNGFLNYDNPQVKQWKTIDKLNTFSTGQHIAKGIGNSKLRAFTYPYEEKNSKRTYEYYYHSVDGINPTSSYDLNIVPYLFMELGKALVNEIQ